MDNLDVIACAGLVTSRYAGFDPASGVPVRITVGAPRFWRPAQQGQLEMVSELAPHERIFWRDGVGDDEMIAAYEARLSQHGSAAIARLATLARKHPGQRLVLLCFEDVGAGEVCHRRWFADWFEEQTGIVVAELQVTGEQPRFPL